MLFVFLSPNFFVAKHRCEKGFVWSVNFESCFVTVSHMRELGTGVCAVRWQ